MAVVWQEPKTDWQATDRFNIADFNRIKNNISYLHENAMETCRYFKIAYMGEDIENYDGYWNVDYFNAFEQNVDIINKNTFSQNFGIAQRFFENGPFIKWNELNRIERACLSIKEILERQEKTITRLEFRLGSMKGVRF